MRLFHASTRQLEIGEIVRAQTSDTYYPEVSKLIDENSDPSRPIRTIAVFCAETSAWAKRFGEAQFPGQVIRLYKVEIEKCVGAPFCITHQLARRIQAGEDYDKLLSEYLNPTREWKFLEFYGPEFRVLETVDPPSSTDVYRCQISYDRDIDEVAKL